MFHGSSIVAIGAYARLTDASKVPTVSLGDVGDAGCDTKVVWGSAERWRVSASMLHRGDGRASGRAVGDTGDGAGLGRL